MSPLMCPQKSNIVTHVCLNFFGFGMSKNVERCVYKSLFILSKYIAIGMQLFEIYCVALVMLFTLTKF